MSPNLKKDVYSHPVSSSSISIHPVVLTIFLITPPYTWGHKNTASPAPLSISDRTKSSSCLRRRKTSESYSVQGFLSVHLVITRSTFFTGIVNNCCLSANRTVTPPVASPESRAPGQRLWIFHIILRRSLSRPSDTFKIGCWISGVHRGQTVQPAGRPVPRCVSIHLVCPQST